jgi:hypothetical protein
MATFKTGGDCPNSEASFFSEMRYDAKSYSCTWGTTTIPDTEGLGSTPVYLQVLNKYNISANLGSQPGGGLLPGMDIHRMDAVSAIKLSLAEALLGGDYWEMYEDCEGGVYFQNVYSQGGAPKTVELDIRACIPTSSKTNQLDMVIVRGYDPPPCRYAGDFRETISNGPGPVNPSSIPNGQFTVDFAEMVGGCHQLLSHHEAVKSFVDPLVEGDGLGFGGQVKNQFWDPKAFESLVTWIVKVGGMESDNADAARASYQFVDTTTWLYRVPEALAFKKLRAGLPPTIACAYDGTSGNVSGGDIVYYEHNFKISNQNYTDRYGTQWPLIVKPSTVVYLGYKITRIVLFPTGNGNNLTYMFVSPVPSLIEQSQGSGWAYTLDDGDDFNMSLFFTSRAVPGSYKDNGEANSFAEIAIAAGSGGDTLIVKVDDGAVYNFDSAPDALPFGTGKGVISTSDGTPYIVADLWVGVTITRPSVIVTTADGSLARTYSDPLTLAYAPVVLYDAPAQLAYAYGGSVIEIGIEQLALSEADNDPTTCQNFDETPLNKMQDRMQGEVLDISLPFCANSSDCAKVASTVFDYQNYGQANTYALTCGPDGEPELGAAVGGYDANLRIQSINYSYNDGSSYTIQVELGPVFSSLGSWNTGSTELATDSQVQREGIIIWSGGDSVNYRVRVQGMGEYNAINSQKMIWRLGERVKVTLYNVPREF